MVTFDFGEKFFKKEKRLEKIINIGEVIQKTIKTPKTVEIKDDDLESKYLVSKIILKNKINLIAGESYSGKTNFILLLANSICHYDKFFDFNVYENHKVLYLDGESGEDLIAYRWKNLIRGEESDKFMFISKEKMEITLKEEMVISSSYFYLTDEEFLDALLNFLKVNEIKVLIIDPIVSFLPYFFKENESVYIRSLINLLREKFCTQGITLILVHHFGKTREGEKMSLIHRIRGASDIGAGADMIWITEKFSIYDNEFYVKCIKNRLEPAFNYTLKINYSSEFGFNLIATEEKQTKKDKFKEEVLALLEELGDEEGLEAEQILSIQEKYGLSRSLKYIALKELKKEGKIISIQRGKKTYYVKNPMVVD